MSSIQGATQYRAIVFKLAAPTPDFSSSEQIVLPGAHTAEAAWNAVFAFLAGPEGAEYVGGAIAAE